MEIEAECESVGKMQTSSNSGLLYSITNYLMLRVWKTRFELEAAICFLRATRSARASNLILGKTLGPCAFPNTLHYPWPIL